MYVQKLNFFELEGVSMDKVTELESVPINSTPPDTPKVDHKGLVNSFNDLLGRELSFLSVYEAGLKMEGSEVEDQEKQERGDHRRDHGLLQHLPETLDLLEIERP